MPPQFSFSHPIMYRLRLTLSHGSPFNYFPITGTTKVTEFGRNTVTALIPAGARNIACYSVIRGLNMRNATAFLTGLGIFLAQAAWGISCFNGSLGGATCTFQYTGCNTAGASPAAEPQFYIIGASGSNWSSDDVGQLWNICVGNANWAGHTFGTDYVIAPNPAANTSPLNPAGLLSSLLTPGQCPGCANGTPAGQYSSCTVSYQCPNNQTGFGNSTGGPNGVACTVASSGGCPAQVSRGFASWSQGKQAICEAMHSNNDQAPIRCGNYGSP